VSLAVDILRARPVRELVEESLFQPGQHVVVTCSTEPDDGGHTDVLEYVGRTGVVEYLEYSCGCGQTYPGDPMIGVRFSDGTMQELWKEELQAAP
jgi:hypothetical protein